MKIAYFDIDSHPASLSPPAMGSVHLWTLRVDPAERRALEKTLSPEEMQRARTRIFEKDQLRFVAFRGQLRRVLARYLKVPPGEVVIESQPSAKPGTTKPRLGEKQSASGLRFNLSHSEDVALLAVTTGMEVGVDVEKIRPVENLSRIASRYLDHATATRIEALSNPARTLLFFEEWTRKEAWVKATGRGIVELALPLPEGASRLIRAPEGFVAALATVAEISL